MFSEELRILDRNTVRYMMDEMQTELENTSAQLESTNAQLESTNAQLESTNAQLESTSAQLQDELRKNELLRQRIAELEKAVGHDQ